MMQLNLYLNLDKYRGSLIYISPGNKFKNTVDGS